MESKFTRSAGACDTQVITIAASQQLQRCEVLSRSFFPGIHEDFGIIWRPPSFNDYRFQVVLWASLSRNVWQAWLKSSPSILRLCLTNNSWLQGLWKKALSHVSFQIRLWSCLYFRSSSLWITLTPGRVFSCSETCTASRVQLSTT